jgi:arylsulfatase
VLGGSAAALVAGCSPERRGEVSSTADPTKPTATTSQTVFKAGRPIIYFYCDQVRYDCIGAAGNPVVLTPNIDAIAAESVRFSTCIVNGPSCRPSRVSMMTGLHVYEHGVSDNTIFPDSALQSHVRRLRDEAGYYTMVVGKTHLRHPASVDFRDLGDTLMQWGFSGGIELPGPGEPQLLSAYSDWLEQTTPKGEVSKHTRLIDYIDSYGWFVPPPDLPPTSLTTYDHMESFCARTAADFVRAYAEDKPLYLQVNFPGPHPPFDATSEYEALIDPNDPRMPLPILVAPQDPIAPLVAAWGIEKMEPWTEADARILLQRYYAKMALVDEGIGMVVQALKETGIWDEAWVVFHSDHGELAADHLFTGKVVAWDGSIRVPLLIRPPGGVEPWVADGQVDTMDTTATLLSLAGLDPSGFGERSLLDRIIEGPFGAHAHDTKVVLFENVGSTGIRTEDYKLTYDLATNSPVELYDLVNDPQEVANQVENGDYLKVVADMMEQLAEVRPLPA